MFITVCVCVRVCACVCVCVCVWLRAYMNMYTCGLCGALLLQLCLVQVHGDTIYCIHMYTIVLYTVMVCDVSCA